MLAKIWAWIKDAFEKASAIPAPSVSIILDFSKMPKLQMGSVGEAVLTLKKRLDALGFYKGTFTKEFYEYTDECVKAFQKARGLTPDGVVGSVTWTELEKDGKAEVKPTNPSLPLGDFFGAPYIGFAIPLLGMNETSATLAKLLVPWWRHVGLTLTSLVGSSNAWCADFLDWLINQAGLKGPGSPMAADTAKWGVRAGGWWFGAPFSMRHVSGGFHTGFFLYWIDQAKGIAAVLSGNSGDMVCIRAYSLSGNDSGHDEIVRGLRWGKDWAPGREVSMQEVLAKYPKLAYIGMDSNTR